MAYTQKAYSVTSFTEKGVMWPAYAEYPEEHGAHWGSSLDMCLRKGREHRKHGALAMFQSGSGHPEETLAEAAPPSRVLQTSYEDGAPCQALGGTSEFPSVPSRCGF